MSGYLYRGSPALEAINAQIMAERSQTKCGPRLGCGPDHGTHAGYRRHRRAGELPCGACYAAAREAWRTDRSKL